MPYRTILRYSLSAGLFALACGGLWLAVRRLILRRRFDRQEALRLITVVYLAALMQIIGLRLGLQPMRPLRASLHLIPLELTLNQWRLGPGPFLYHVLGNMLWFAPLGILLRVRRPRARWVHALLAGALLSLCMEALQALLGTGKSDVDDVLLNALGALAGWIGAGLPRRLRRPMRHRQRGNKPAFLRVEDRGSSTGGKDADIRAR